MKTIGSILFLLVLVVLAAPAQQNVVHFKKLQEFLPTISLPAWERGKPRGSTQSALGISTSEASIVYTGTRKTEQEEAVNTEISVTISDISLIPYAAMAFAFQHEFENETEDGYEKSTTIKKTFKAIEKVQKADYKSCGLSFPVANRFLVEIRGSGMDDVSLLHKIAESMDLAKLEKTTAGK
jgi:hypothetical protein